MTPVRRIGLVCKPGKDEALSLALDMRRAFLQHRFLAEAPVASVLGEKAVSATELAHEADLMIVLGGDGTLIRAARLLNGKPTPILGVNLGSLGFLTEIRVGDAVATLGDWLAGKTQVEARMKLTCSLRRKNETLLTDEVLNDVVISKSALARIAEHETFVGNQYLASFKSDGVIFSTPTGSTAYSLSAGGPIVHPSIDAVIVTPICPHALTQRPIVVSAEHPLTVRLASELSDVYLTIDGQAGQPLQKGDVVEVRKSPNRVMLVRNGAPDFFSVLREKLHWGER